MKKLILTWLLPVAIALTLVIVARVWMFSIYVVNNYSMLPNLSKGDIALCIKSISQNRNKVVLHTSESSDSLLLKRQIAIPGDTLFIKEGVIFVNGQKVNTQFNSVSRFCFLSDSISSMCKYLNDNNIPVDYQKAHLGYFECKLSDEKIKKMISDFAQSRIKRKSIEPKTRPLGRMFGHAFYWNYDNLGSILIPKKGMKIKLGKRSFYLYKEIIEQETNETPELKGMDVFIGGVKTAIYVFKKDYVFLVNDNRSNYNDSRAYGFVCKDKLKGSYLFKLPW